MGLDEARFYDPRFVAIVPMGFCYPGTGSSGDLAPRRECAPAWREAVLDALGKVELSLILGAHALRYHRPGYRRLTDAVEDWAGLWPDTLVLPHPSPRNRPWFSKHPWFESEVVPRLQARITAL